jgi:hypothetical protein
VLLLSACPSNVYISIHRYNPDMVLNSHGTWQQQVDNIAAGLPQNVNITSPSGSQQLYEISDVPNYDSTVFSGGHSPYDSSAALQPRHQHEYVIPALLLDETYNRVHGMSLTDKEPAGMLEYGNARATQTFDIAPWPQEQIEWQPGLNDARHASERSRCLGEVSSSHKSPLLDPPSDLYGYGDTSMWPAVDLPNLECNPSCGSPIPPMILNECSDNTSIMNHGQSLYSLSDDPWSTSLISQPAISSTIFSNFAHEYTPLHLGASNSLYSGPEDAGIDCERVMAEPMPSGLHAELIDPHLQSQAVAKSSYTELFPQFQLQESHGFFCTPLNHANMNLGDISSHDMAAHDASWSSLASTTVNREAPVPWVSTPGSQVPPVPAPGQTALREGCLGEARSPAPPAKHRGRAIHDSSNLVDQIGGQLEICLYTDPITERERKRYRGRKGTRIVDGKVQRACFPCQFYARKASFS